MTPVKEQIHFELYGVACKEHIQINIESQKEELFGGITSMRFTNGSTEFWSQNIHSSDISIIQRYNSKAARDSQWFKKVAYIG